MEALCRTPPRLAFTGGRRDHSAMFSNGTKVWLFLVGICVGFLILGEELGGRTGLFLGFLVAVTINALIFFMGETSILSRLGARKLKGRDAWGLQDRIEAMARELETPPPQLYLMESPTATAFSVGFSGRRTSLCVTTGLLEKLTPDEVEAVLAQQLCHLTRMESFGFGVSSVLANTLMGVGQFLDTLWPPNFFLDRKQKPFLTLFSPLGWLIIRAVINRSTYSENDRAAADLLKSRERLGEVLWKLEGLAQTRPLEVPPCTSHLFIVNPEGFRQKNFFLRSHPPLADRLRTLIGTPTV